MDVQTAKVEKVKWLGYDAVKAESDSLIMTVGCYEAVPSSVSACYDADS